MSTIDEKARPQADGDAFLMAMAMGMIESEMVLAIEPRYRPEKKNEPHTVTIDFGDGAKLIITIEYQP